MKRRTYLSAVALAALFATAPGCGDEVPTPGLTGADTTTLDTVGDSLGQPDTLLADTLGSDTAAPDVNPEVSQDTAGPDIAADTPQVDAPTIDAAVADVPAADVPVADVVADLPTADVAVTDAGGSDTSGPDGIQSDGAGGDSVQGDTTVADVAVPDVAVDAAVPDVAVDVAVADVGVADVGIDVGVADVGVADVGVADVGIDVGVADVGIDVGVADVGIDVAVDTSGASCPSNPSCFTPTPGSPDADANLASGAAPTLAGGTPDGWYQLDSIDFYTAGTFAGWAVSNVSASSNGNTFGSIEMQGDEWGVNLNLDINLSMDVIIYGAVNQDLALPLAGGGCYAVSGNQLEADFLQCGGNWIDGVPAPTSFDFEASTGNLEVMIVLSEAMITALLPADLQGTAGIALDGPLPLVLNFSKP